MVKAIKLGGRWYLGVLGYLEMGWAGVFPSHWVGVSEVLPPL